MTPQERNLSGIYTRIKRDGKYQTVDLTDMTPEELAKYLDEWGTDCNFLKRFERNFSIFNNQSAWNDDTYDWYCKPRSI